jgi:hypothetical protein
MGAHMLLQPYRRLQEADMAQLVQLVRLRAFLADPLHVPRDIRRRCRQDPTPPAAKVILDVEAKTKGWSSCPAAAQASRMFSSGTRLALR